MEITSNDSGQSRDSEKAHIQMEENVIEQHETPQRKVGQKGAGDEESLGGIGKVGGLQVELFSSC